MQSRLNRQRIETINKQIAFVVEVLSRETGAQSEMAGEIIGYTEFQSCGEITFQIRIGVQRCSPTRYFSIGRDGISK